MITAERLEELIKQQAMIYDTKTTKIMLDKYSRVYQDCLILGHPIGGKCTFYLRDLFETEEHAEWALKTVIERTERFEPPMWGDIEHEYEFHFTCQNYTHKETNETLSTPQHFIFYVRKNAEPSYNHILIRNCKFYPLNIIVFDDTATKENYIKACEIVRDLFYKEVE